MPSQWDHVADKDLLLAIIEANNLKAIEWSTIAHELQRKGHPFNNEGCRQHFQKIRKESRTSSPSASASTIPVATSAKKRKSKAASIEEGQEDDDEEAPSKIQSKRVKKESDNQSAAQLGVETEE
ncbi:hypothetical protein ACHAPC_007103 [Botrytis cinerea]|uniref:Myb-like domain-containing protein n=1 Tax=Botryotinia fuckeliana (strain BcDW1) TaxID=1290391 RepID=M7U2Z0_BOTF1|nr:hypothetical protein BcDW1_1071 [Botrytis cinerea BcDW1]